MIEELSNEALQEITGLIKLQYGYDFTNYASASLKRRLVKFMHEAGVSFFDLKFNIINEKSFFFWMLESLTVNVTEMFRDPGFYKMMREIILPKLGSYPLIKIWHAGCATGEEVFSIAIVLKELNLLKRCKVYATDINMSNIEKATNGIIPLQQMKQYTKNYQQAGGNADFSDYYTARYDNAIISKELRKNILFSQHNLVTDSVFNEFHLVICRNVLIYFNKELQNHVIGLFYQSLAPLGYLALGAKESLLFNEYKDKFEAISSQHRIFRLKQDAV